MAWRTNSVAAQNPTPQAAANGAANMSISNPRLGGTENIQDILKYRLFDLPLCARVSSI
jgi:hypothetical protein